MSNEFGIQLEPFTNILPGQKLKGNRNPLLKSNKFGKPKSMLVADPGKMYSSNDWTKIRDTKSLVNFPRFLQHIHVV